MTLLSTCDSYGQYVHEGQTGLPALLVCTLAGIDPVTVDVDGFREVVYRRLKIFQADSAGDATRIPLPVHFDFARPFVVAEGAVKLRLQGFDVLAFRRRLPLASASSHPSSSTQNGAQ